MATVSGSRCSISMANRSSAPSTSRSRNMSDFVLYGYCRSSAAFRARIALNLKGIKPELRFIHLLKDGGQQHTTEYKTLSPMELIPALVHTGQLITQSIAVMEYLDE